MLLLVLWTRVAHGDGAPAKDQALLMLRILAYDHNLANRVDNKTVTIVIVSKSGSSESEDFASELANRIKAIAKSTTIMNNTISVVRLIYADKSFEADVTRQKAAALYIAPGLADNVGTITTATAEHKLLSFTAGDELVGAGVSIGLALDDGRPQILVNLPASRKEGADLDVALLKAAKVVKK